jgi:hypothetical protein
MILKFDEKGMAKKRSLAFHAETDEEAAFVLVLEQAFHQGEIHIQAVERGKLVLEWFSDGERAKAS